MGGSQATADEVGVGAILGTPFMPGTNATFMVGSAVLIFRNRRNFGTHMDFNAKSTRRDLLFSMAGYTLAFLAALIPNETTTTGIGVFLIVLYFTYVYRSVTSGELIDDEGLEELHLGEVLESAIGLMPLIENRGYANNPSTPSSSYRHFSRSAN